MPPLTLPHSERSYFARVAVLLTVVVLMAALVWLVHAFARRPLVQESDFAWFLDVARHLLDGRGLTSNMIYPAHLGPGSAAHLDRQPFISNPPLPFFLLAGLMAVLGPTDAAGAAYGLTSYLFLVVATGLSASVLTRDLRIIVPSAALVAIEPRVLEHSVVAGTDLLFAAVFAILVAATVRAARTPTKTSVAACALTLAVAEGVRFTAYAFLPAICLVLWLYTRRLSTLIGVVASFLIAYALFAAGGDTGRAAGVLAVHSTSLYPGDSSQGTLDPLTLRLLAEQPAPFIEKWLSSLRTSFQEISGAATPYAIGASVLAGVVLSRGAEWRPTLVMLGLALSATVLLTMITQTGPRLYLPFVPFVFVLIVAACFVERRLGRLGLTAVALLVVASFALDTGAAARRQSERAARSVDVITIASELRQRAGSHKWTATDLPEEIAWRADRPVLRLPNDRQTLSLVERQYRPVDFVLLTTERIRNARYLPSSYWADVFTSERLQEYDLVWVFDGPAVKAKLFRRSANVP